MLVKRNTEELEIASTRALSFSLCRQMKELRKISLLSLNFSEVKSERTKKGREKNEGKRQVKTIVERDRNIKSDWMLPFSQWGEILHHASFAFKKVFGFVI